MHKFQIPRVVKMPVQARATDALRESIVAGIIAPSSRITELQLSEQMSLSRATVRTALQQLATEGLTKLVPYTGWTVISLTHRDAWELYTLRSSLERLAAQLAAKALNKGRGMELRRAFADLAAASENGRAGKVADSDFALHKTIIRLARHERLAAQYAVIEQQIRMYIRSSDALVSEPGEIVAQHSPIIEAILAGNDEMSGHLSELHALTEGRKLSNHLKGRDRGMHSGQLSA